MRYTVIIASICLLLPVMVTGQRRHVLSPEVKKVLEEMKNTRNMSYKYDMRAEYPNGQKDHIEGVAYMGNDNKLMYNSNDAMLTIYDGNWFYRADHREKTIALLNANKYLNKEYKETLEKDMFQNAAISQYLDSVIAKYGTVKKLTKTGDTTYIELQFPENLHIKSISIVFAEKEKKMVSYITRTYEPWRGREYGKNKGIAQVISCTDFSRPENNKFAVSNFVKIKSNKVVLRRYSKYTLTSKL